MKKFNQLTEKTMCNMHGGTIDGFGIANTVLSLVNSVGQTVITTVQNSVKGK